jgi:feruloyl esterase
MQVALWNQPSNAPYHISDSLFPVIGAEVMRQCDNADGVVDGIISAPKRCDFHPEALLCSPETVNKSTCLTSPQIGLLYKLYNDWYETNNTFVFPQYTYGSEFQWSLLSTGAENNQFSEAFAQYVVFQNPNWTVANFSYQTVLDEEHICGVEGLDANNFDLTPFHHHRGKLLHYVGLADGLIPPGSSEYYYNHVLRTMTPQGVRVSDFYRLFAIPGMGHCSMTRPGGTAPWYINGAGQAGSIGQSVRGVPGYQDADHDALRALIRWVEDGVAPKQIIATKYKNDTVEKGVVQQRPLCMYPGLAVFRGGDMTKPENWVCKDETQEPDN